MMNRLDEYFERSKIIKPFIESDNEIIKKIISSYGHCYNGEDLREDVIILGTGDHHKVYGLGMINKPFDIHLALRLRIPYAYSIDSEIGCAVAHDFDAYEMAFNNRKNVPYFSCLVIFENKKDKKIAGILTEDITQSKKYKIINHKDRESVIRLNGKKREKIFIDPLPYEIGGISGMTRYFNDEAVVNVQRYNIE